MKFRKPVMKPKTPKTQPLVSDWTTGWSVRDWADLPTWHPRRGDTER